MIFAFGNPSNPGKLWLNHNATLSEDILYKEQERLGNKNLKLNDEMLNVSIFFLNENLQTYNKSTLDYVGIPTLPQNFDPNKNIFYFNSENN